MDSDISLTCNSQLNRVRMMSREEYVNQRPDEHGLQPTAGAVESRAAAAEAARYADS